MNGADQFYIFLVCAAFGIFSGVIYDVFYCATLPFKKSWVKIAGDFAFSLIFILLYVFVSLMFSFPAFRLYMFLGCAFGFYLYLKSFHKIVAFSAAKVYNKIYTTKRDKKKCHERSMTPRQAKRSKRKQKESQ
ncbi:MAG: spore cortex biosynthesis protein YabQ [Clostridia bacterium]|nr:spore cortex biosynthesis protein YabQ [Clostridia bacterium]